MRQAFMIVMTAVAAFMLVSTADARQRSKPAKITVQPRSSLNAGTDVAPGSQGYDRYATQPGFTPLSTNDYGVSLHSSLPGRFEAGKPFVVDFRAPPEFMR